MRSRVQSLIRARTGMAALVLAASCVLVPGLSTHAAGTPTPIVDSSPVPTATITPTVVPTAASTATPTPTIPPRIEAPATAKPRRHRKIKKTHVRSGRATATPTPVPERRHTRKKHHKKSKPKPTPTPIPTPTPPITLSTEDSIAPVTCNGPGKPVAPRPFLVPPYSGWNSIVSYFDHDSPNFLRDGQIVIATGLQISIDSTHRAADFPAYWSTNLRQYVYYDGHNGYDYNLWYQPVRAAAAGKVIFAGYEYPQLTDHGYGKMVMIAHRAGYVTLYGHFSKLAVKAGQKVRAGQKIGISGNSGHSSGPHLHFTLFHNCTPTDPYGWIGNGPDPLQNYKGEVSQYLWVRPPRVFNPVPQLPGASRLPRTTSTRLVLLRLPSTSGGTASFTTLLRKEAATVVRLLHARGGVKVDMMRGAVDVSANVSSAILYALPDVASVASPDVSADARAEVLNSLAQASLVTPHRSLPLGTNHHWTGYLVQWEGRTFLFGRGPRSARVRLRLTRGSGGALVKQVKTDGSSGTYAVDLGHLTSQDRVQIQRQLDGAAHHRSSVVTAQAPSISAVRPARRSSSASTWLLTGGTILVLAILGVVWAARRRVIGNTLE